MSGKLSRDKGARGERLAAAAIKSVTDVNVTRAARNGVDGATDLLGLPGFAIEVKYGYQILRPNDWWKQAQLQCEGNDHPLLIYKKKGSKEWVIRVRLNSLKTMSHLNPDFWMEVGLQTFGEMYKGNEFDIPWKRDT